MIVFYLIHWTFIAFVCGGIYGLVKVRRRWRWTSIVGLAVAGIALCLIADSGVVRDIAWSISPGDRVVPQIKLSVGIAEIVVGVVGLFSLLVGAMVATEAPASELSNRTA